MDEKDIWTSVLSKIKEEINSLSFQTWFEETELYRLEKNVAKIIVPFAIHKTHIINNYRDIIVEGLYEVTNTNYELELLLRDEIIEDTEPKVNTTSENSSNITSNSIEMPYIKSNLNSKYTFENFIVGNSNKFAHAAALAVAENPGKMYNPLFIYGNSGLGKTHLMHAIGNYISKNSDKKVLYVTSEQFVSDFIGINKKDENGTNFTYVDFFKQKYRNIDVLIIDDIQYLGGATETQKEFFHTFNTLYGDNKQIIISSDRSPDDLKILEDRLRTRFCWGLPVDIYPPDFELRVAILKKRIVGEAINKEIPDQVIEYMASNLGSDIRQLEGAVTRLVAYSTIMGSEIDLNLAIEALKDYINKGVSEKNNVNKIQKVVAEYFQISVEDLKSKKRNSNISFPRQIAMFLCRKFTDESFPKIGIEFGGKDHSTVMHSCEKIEREIKTNKDLADTIDKLEKDIH
ncbi:MAG: chromosomal replication initiator protein DnaA [Bacilli bacterium]|jgi:chromosomal replication initiator protein dnaA|nr:chromosomal replication initiator protein DnaA [Clostridium sp.]MDY6015457.1 chromosomal replication initiator protein DnaA [Bacilli bacterium]CCZ60278.1 chromosomal replication initiator protein DnaA [Clostridium sp. CAG:710]